MPAGINNGRTRADRKKITVPVTGAEMSYIDKQARKAKISRAEFVRRACGIGESMLSSAKP